MENISDGIFEKKNAAEDGYISETDADEPEKTLVQILKTNNMKIAAAESLTGGMISEYITRVSGASQVFECGVCSYSNRIKHEILGVSSETLEKYTEYSEQTAAEMAAGIRRLSGADMGVSTTGIAGPSGGTEDKPVGLVYIGISTKERTYAKKFMFGSKTGDEREHIRKLACINALTLAVKELGRKNSEY